MSGCILHYGMHKTGSSSIQDSLHAGLADPRFRYVDLGRPNASAAVTMAFSATPERQNMNRKYGRSRDEVEPMVAASRARLAAELDGTDEATRILSAEHMPLLKRPELAALLAFVRARRTALRAVGYVRNPAAYMESVFQQHVKGGRGEFDMGRSYPAYQRRLGRLEEAIGREHIEYWPYDPRRFPGGCVVQDFCARLGIRFDPAAIRRSNEGLSLPALRLLYAYRKHGPGYGVGQRAVRENFALVRLLATLPGPKPRLHASLVEPVLRENAADIAWMEQRLGESLAQPLHEDASALRGEEELLRFESGELEWLTAQLGAAPLAAADPAAVAQRVHELRERVLKSDGEDAPKRLSWWRKLRA